MSDSATYVVIDELKIGMILGENIYDEDGNVLLAKGIELRNAFIRKIRSLGLEQVIVSEASKVTVGDDTSSEEEEIADTVRRDMLAAETRDEAVNIVKESLETLVNGGIQHADKIILVVNQIINEILRQDDVVFNLSHLKSVDDYTFEHTVNVCALSIITGISIGYPKIKLIELGVGAILHDIGKILIPQEILNKPGLLTDEEFDVVKRHTVLGYEVLKKIPSVSDVSAKVALHHHERFDGNGYPDGQKENEIHSYAKIVAIADVFDALTSDRVYSKKISPFKAMKYIVSMIDAHFDREIVARFIKLIGYYYKGLMVRLNTGEVAIVKSVNKTQPVLRVLLDSRGNRLQNHYEIDLSKNPSVSVNSVIFTKGTVMESENVDLSS